MMKFKYAIHNSETILTEGALVERLKKEYNLEMDNSINHAGLIYNAPDILELIYRQYIDIGKKYSLPIMIMTPTRKVNFESINKSNFKGKQLIADSYHFLNKIKRNYGDYSDNIHVGGLLGCKENAYSGKKIMNIDASYSFHKHQTIQFQQQDIDYLFAGIMPEINEAVGLAKAMAETQIPYIISFMIQKDGCLLDGTYLTYAIQIIDEMVKPNPIFYMTNCIHPTNLIKALSVEQNMNNQQLKRLWGIQANASTLSPEELESCSSLHKDDFDNIVKEMMILRKNSNLKIFGGCCGTNDVFIEKLSQAIINPMHSTGS